jgi:hypothetical protein
MAAGVLATVPMAAGVVATEALPVIVFTCIVATIAIFAIGLPLASRRSTVPTEAATPVDPAAPPAPAAAESMGPDGERAPGPQAQG